jgi:hypothetical protein
LIRHPPVTARPPRAHRATRPPLPDLGHGDILEPGEHPGNALVRHDLPPGALDTAAVLNRRGGAQSQLLVRQQRAKLGAQRRIAADEVRDALGRESRDSRSDALGASAQALGGLLLCLDLGLHLGLRPLDLGRHGSHGAGGPGRGSRNGRGPRTGIDSGVASPGHRHRARRAVVGHNDLRVPPGDEPSLHLVVAHPHGVAARPDPRRHERVEPAEGVTVDVDEGVGRPPRTTSPPACFPRLSTWFLARRRTSGLAVGSFKAAL